MASHGEKAQKLSGEAFSRIRGDHELFLEAYEKPSQIYRFLKSRHFVKPLFLHRCLSYLQHRNSRRGNRRRIKVDQLLKHTKDAKPDLASQTKSDNHLKITFSSLENGFDLQKILANGGWSHEDATPSLSHDSRVMEVEVLLYRFSQPAAESVLSSPAPRPCQCTSLGRLKLDYNPAHSPPRDQTRAEPEGGDKQPFLTVPESVLSWKGSRNFSGTLVLVFKAADCRVREEGVKEGGAKAARRTDPIKTSRLLTVELSRLNRADIANRITKARTMEHLSKATPTATPTATQAPRHPMTISTATPKGPPPPVVNSVSSPLGSGERENRRISEALFRPSAPQVHYKADSVTNGHAWSATKASLPPPVKMAASQPPVKPQCEKRDACVMTDLSLGTTYIGELLLPRSEPHPPDTPTPRPNERLSEVPRLDVGFTAKNGHTSPWMPPPIEVSDRCTSPLFPQSMFSVQNGLKFVLPDNMPSRDADFPYVNGTGGFHLSKDGGGEGENLDSDDMSVTDEGEPALTNGDIFDRGHARRPGVGQGGVVPDDNGLIVSFPRALLPAQSPPGSPSSSSLSPSASPSSHHSKRLSSSGYRRRNEIQLLMDGDKPRGQRITADEVPVFTAEDISYRSKRSSVTVVTTHGSWRCRGSSTRRITPVETPPCPVSPSNSNGIAPSNSGAVAPSSTSAAAAATTVVGATSFSPPYPCRKPLAEGRKRSRSEMEFLLPSPSPAVPSPPPTKVAKLDEEGGVEEEEGGVGGGRVTEPAEGRGDHLVIDLRPEVRDKISTEPNRLKGTFLAEMVVFDSRGDCMLAEGDYSLLMQQCQEVGGAKRSPAPLTLKPLLWNSVFGGDKSTDEDGPLSNILLKFSVSWSDGLPRNRVESQLQTALDLKKLRDAYFPPLQPPAPTPPPSLPPLPPSLSSPTRMEATAVPSDYTHFCADQARPSSAVAQACPTTTTGLRPSTTTLLPSSPTPSLIKPPSDDGKPMRVIFNFLYSNNSLQQTESRWRMQCPWCCLACSRLYSLLKHMSLCHPRFIFTYSPIEGGTAIDVHVNKLYNTGSSLDPWERGSMSILSRRGAPVQRLPFTAVLVERHTDQEEDISDFLNDGTWKRGLNTNRLYYHCVSCLPLLPNEVDQDTEVDLATNDWQRISCQRIIEEYLDVNRGEKELMKLWNLFAVDNRLIADKQLPAACLKFAHEKREAIIAKGVTKNFMTHLISLSDFGLVSPGTIRSCMMVVLADNAS